MFAVALPPDQFDRYDAELIINARELTDVTITNSSGSEVFTVYGGWSLKYRVPVDMRMRAEIEDKGDTS